ncbi:MAG: hypothetical protein M1831_002322 [Alyxoria varia]|nr:MAG: hypothetical protein M1831_002322 [Alyxoria varia]
MASRSNPNRRSTAARGEYIETDTGNKISRRSKIEGTPHIILAGRVVVQSDVCLRGDLVREADDTKTTKKSDDKSGKSSGGPQSRTAISVGRYTFLAQGCTLHPPCRIFKNPNATSAAASTNTPNPNEPASHTQTQTQTQSPTQLSHYHQKIGEHTYIGPYAHISAALVGNNCHIGAHAVIGNGCVLKDCVKVLEGAVMPDGMVASNGVVVGGNPARVLGDVGDGWGVAGNGGAVGGLGVGAVGEEMGWCEGGELRELVRSVK